MKAFPIVSIIGVAIGIGRAKARTVDECEGIVQPSVCSYKSDCVWHWNGRLGSCEKLFLSPDSEMMWSDAPMVPSGGGPSAQPSNSPEIPSRFQPDSEELSGEPSGAPMSIPSYSPSLPLDPQCFADVLESDTDGDGFISQEEFLSLINIIGAQYCYSQTSYLTVPQMSAYFALSCVYGPNSLISSIIPFSILTNEELIDVCQTTSELIDSTCAPSQSPSGSVAPSESSEEPSTLPTELSEQPSAQLSSGPTESSEHPSESPSGMPVPAAYRPGTLSVLRWE